MEGPTGAPSHEHDPNGKNKLRDPRELFLLLVGPRWFVRLSLVPLLPYGGHVVGSSGFKRNLAKLQLMFLTSRGTKWVKAEHQYCGMWKVEFSSVRLQIEL